jgi:GMC oxidoreductase/FAD dependent oxidoreductase
VSRQSSDSSDNETRFVQVDATYLPIGAELEADVAVVGAGPAGIVLALELARAGRRVTLVESGGDSFDADVQQLGDTAGGDYWHVPMSLATRRQIGGASNLWAGRCVPFDPIDFQPRDIVGGARWPMSYEEMEAYFARACEWCLCGEPAFDAREIPNLAERSLVPGWPGGDIRATALERWSLPTNFGKRYRAMLAASPLITLVSNLTCTEIVCDPAGSSVSHMIAKTPAGACVTVRAARHVLACGGLEAVRLLFASNRLHPEGIGNRFGHLGRWYMTHVMVSIAQVHFTTPPEETIYDFERDPDGVYVRRRFTFAPEFLLAQNLPNTAMYLDNPEIGDPTHDSAILSLTYLMLVSPLGRYLVAEGIRRSKIKTTHPGSLWAHLKNILSNLGPAIRFALTIGYQRYLIRGRKAPGVFVASASNVYSILYHGEHVPHHSSHVAPTCERDALGVPRLRTQLHFGDADIRGVIEAHEHLDRYLRRHKLGHLKYFHEDSERAIREQLFGGYAQIGITRMSTRPEDGVLDPNLAVHGFDDLFVASSSAFTTSGQANPTLMIVAIALRLGDHLHRTLR